MTMDAFEFWLYVAAILALCCVGCLVAEWLEHHDEWARRRMLRKARKARRQYEQRKARLSRLS